MSMSEAERWFVDDGHLGSEDVEGMCRNATELVKWWKHPVWYSITARKDAGREA